jgi:CubicO group peptidase (beta-lactamase class C family)
MAGCAGTMVHDSFPTSSLRLIGPGRSPMLQSVSPASPFLPLPVAAPEEAGFDAARLARIGSVLNRDIADGQIPGAVVGIVRKDKLVALDAYGYRDARGGQPMSVDCIFNIASMTKPMTAVAALMLYEEGKLLLDDPLYKYYPKVGALGVGVMDDPAERVIDAEAPVRPIMIIDLMRHTCGLPYGNRGNTAIHRRYPHGSHAAAAAMNGVEFLDRLASAPLLHHPGKVWDYGFGLDVLGLVIEKISGQNLGQFLEARLFGPLGMPDTAFYVPHGKSARYAKALPDDPTTGRPQTLPDLRKLAHFDCGGGGAVSTAADYLRFALMLLGKGEFAGARILGRKTVEYMLSNQLAPDVVNLIADADPTRAGYGFGLGVAVRTMTGITPMLGSVGEFNWPGMSGTNWWADPREELAVVFMSHAPGPIRWHYRRLINTLVYQAIVD